MVSGMCSTSFNVLKYSTSFTTATIVTILVHSKVTTLLFIALKNSLLAENYIQCDLLLDMFFKKHMSKSFLFDFLLSVVIDKCIGRTKTIVVSN